MQYDESKEIPNDASLKRISTLANLQAKLEDEVAQLQTLLKNKEALLRNVAEKDLPEAMSEVGLKTFATDRGYSITVSTDYYASLAQDSKYRVPAIKWLRDNGLDAIIQRVVALKFGKGEDKQADKLKKWITDNFKDYRPDDFDAVNTNSFKAAVREMLKKGKAVPLAEIGVNEVTRATIERARQ
jgi:hypothetical protein